MEKGKAARPNAQQGNITEILCGPMAHNNLQENQPYTKVPIGHTHKMGRDFGKC